MTPSLLDVLFRMENKFELDNFLELKYGAIQALCEMTQVAVSKIFDRLQDSEASLGDKIFLAEVIGLSASQIQVSTNSASLSPLKQSWQEEQAFFGQPTEHPIVLAGKITRKLTQPKIDQGKPNAFLKIADKYIFSLIFLIEDFKISKHAQLLAKCLHSLALCMDCAQNHW